MKEATIIIPAYNSAKYIERAIRSCLMQSISKERFDVVVIDDGSTDDTPKILAKYSDYIKQHCLPNNQGLPNALNLGLKVARSRYFIRVDSDDYVHEDYLRVLLLYLNTNHTAKSVACDYIVVDENEEKLQRKSWAQEPIGCCVMYRMDAATEIGLYDSSFKMAEEIEFHKRYSDRYGKTPVIDIPLYRYYRHESNMTNNLEVYEQFRRKINNENI